MHIGPGAITNATILQSSREPLGQDAIVVEVARHSQGSASTTRARRIHLKLIRRDKSAIGTVGEGNPTFIFLP